MVIPRSVRAVADGAERIVVRLVRYVVGASFVVVLATAAAAASAG
jgi:hypothetical protein